MQQQLGSSYLLEGRLGSGGMGEVYLARSAQGSPVAVKLLRGELVADPDLVSRFVQESQLLRSIRHPNVVRVLDLVVEGDRIGIVMEYVPGGDLRRAVPFPCPFRLTVDLLVQVAEGLTAIHDAGITHRDLKPENVLVEQTAYGSLRARVSDFGVSHRSDSVSLRHNGIVGTAGYLSPESAAGLRPGPPGDVYSLGVMLYEMCTGRRPFVAETTLGLIRAHADCPVTRPEGMPDPVWDLVASMLAKDPALRPTAERTAAVLRGLRPSDGVLLGARVPAARVPGPDTLLPAAPEFPAGCGPLPAGPVPGDALPTELRLPAAGTGAVWAEPVPEHPVPEYPLSDLGAPDGPPGEYPPPVGPVPGGAGPERPGEVRARDSGRRRRANPLLVPLAALLVLAGVVLGGDLLTGGSAPVPQARPDGPVATVTAPPRTVLAPGPSWSGPAGSGGGGTSPRGRGGTAPVTVPTTVGGPAASPSRPQFPVPAVPQLALNQPGGAPEESDGRVRLSITGVEPTAGTLTSVMVLWPGGSRSLDALDGYSGPYPVTVSGLRNGTAYPFTARVCNSFGECSSSRPLSFTPYALPTVAAPSGRATSSTATVSWAALVRNGHPARWTCTLTVTSTAVDDGAPDGRPVPLTAGRISWPAVSGSLYQARESCTDGTSTVAGSSSLFQAP